MPKTKQTILITGGLGYIGSHAVVAFEEAGYKTVIVDNLSNSSINSLENIAKILGYKPVFFEVDLRDSDKLEEIFKSYSFDGVVHFAGLKSPNKSLNESYHYYDNNINGSLSLFKVMNDFNCKKIIFSSSAAIYSSNNSSPVKEDGELGTIHPYGTTKLILEFILKDLSVVNNLNVIALRYFNPIGAHISGLIGEKPDGVPNNLLPYILDVASGKREILTVYGNDYDTSDGTGIRDYIHVVDLVEAHLRAYVRLDLFEKGEFKAINIGTGKGTSVLEMINLSNKITKIDIPYKIESRREGDLASVYANADLAKVYLNWEAKKSVEEGIEDCWRFNKSI